MKIIIISVDALRADSLSSYGYEKTTSPCIDKIAREGALCKYAYTQSNWTYPSFYSLITGLYPTVHGITRFDQKIASKVATLPELLAGKGYKSFLLSNLYPLIDQNRFGAHFSETENFEIDRDIEKLKRKIKLLKDDDLFMLIHVGNYVHEPYFAPEELVRDFWTGDFPERKVIRMLTEKLGLPDDSLRDVLRSINLKKVRLSLKEKAYLKACYDAGIKYVDRWIGNLADFLEDNFGKEALLIITSDHGQGFLEHGFFGHGLSLYQELVRVPLILKWKGRIEPGVMSSPVQLIDIFPTIAEMVGLETDRELDGVSFKPCLEGNAGEDRRAICEGFPFLTYICGMRKLIVSFHQVMPVRERIKEIKKSLVKRNLRRLAFHLYSIFATSLYNLSEDPKEKKNLIGREKKMAREMKKFAGDWYLKCAGRALPVATEEFADEATIEQLKGLGYL